MLETRKATGRVTPATDHVPPDATLIALSTPGLTLHSPARRSLPNHATTMATRSRLGHVACNSSSEAITSDAAVVTRRFSGADWHGPSTRTTADVSKPNSVEPGKSVTARTIRSSAPTGRTH